MGREKRKEGRDVGGGKREIGEWTEDEEREIARDEKRGLKASLFLRRFWESINWKPSEP